MPHLDNLSYEFGPYRLDLAQRVLTRAGETVSLTPKATEILVRLVANAGHLVEKDDLLREVWPDTFVEESNLTQNIFTLRRALGDERSDPKYIETVARRGYRFVASVRVCEASEEPGAESANAQQSSGDGDGDETPERVVIAVMPFINATGDDGLEYLTEGLTDNIINNLSRVSRLRVMSRSAVFRYNGNDIDPRLVGKELSAKAVLVGKINVRPVLTATTPGPTGASGDVSRASGDVPRARGIVISAELVEVATGWQLWGESFDVASTDLLQIQDTITRQLLVNLKLKLTGEEERQVTARYTENPEAYQAYLEGRYHWSRYTRRGIEKAIGHFRQAIEQDPNYALAYAAIVDCYLRLATNYLPPEEDLCGSEDEPPYNFEASTRDKTEERIKLRFRWDWKSVERELRRANELKTNYPSIHQWYAAYQKSKRLYSQSLPETGAATDLRTNSRLDSKLASRIPSVQLTPAEEVQILCSVARDQLAIGNYDAAELILQPWSEPSKWPKLNLLNAYTAADLLFTLGSLFGSIAGTKQVLHGHRHAEALLNGSIAGFEQLGIKSRSAEARVELTRCYYRQGLLEMARETISTALSELPDGELELKTLGLIILGVIERDSGRLKDSLAVLREAASVEVIGCLVTGRCNIDLATTLKELGLSERNERYLAEARLHFLKALYESEALGHHRNVASVENNIGFLLLDLGHYDESEPHLLRAQRLFEALSDSVRGAQVNDTLARLYIETKQFTFAQETIDRAVKTLLMTDSEALLAEALTTKGSVACKRGQFGDAKKSFEAAHRVAQRCGDHRGAAIALLALFQEIGDRLDSHETLKIALELRNLLPLIQQPSLITRVENSIVSAITNTDDSNEDV